MGKTVQPGRNGGTLKVGNPGCKGGTGRPPSEVRASCRLAFDERIPVLQEIADSPETSPGDRLKAIDMLAKYGLPAQVENSGVTRVEVVHVDVNNPQEPEEPGDAAPG